MPKKPINVETLTQRKVTMPIIFVIALVVIGWRADNLTVGYLSKFFMEKAVAEEQFEEIGKAVRSNAVLITGHIRTYELNENAKETRKVQDEIFNLELYVADKGQNQLTLNRARDLNNDLARLGRQRECIVRNNSNENCGSII